MEFLCGKDDENWIEKCYNVVAVSFLARNKNFRNFCKILLLLWTINWIGIYHDIILSAFCEIFIGEFEHLYNVWSIYVWNAYCIYNECQCFAYLVFCKYKYLQMIDMFGQYTHYNLLLIYHLTPMIWIHSVNGKRENHLC